jgi:hypothetical protein
MRIEGHRRFRDVGQKVSLDQPGEMFQRFGILFLIDTGMSEAVDDSGARCCASLQRM